MQIDETNYVDKAEQAIKELIRIKTEEQNKKNSREASNTKPNNQKRKDSKQVVLVTTSKIRNLLAMVSDIYNDVVNTKNEKLSKDVVGRINYMKLRFYYEAGRDEDVKQLLQTANVFRLIDEIGISRSNFLLFSRYIEALVAFRKYYGGKDD